jgi:decaprenyl-phosphate phosphoribosyltransferase
MTAVQTRPARPLSRELVRALRPRQWPKNLLVFAAPMAAGDLAQAGVLVRSLLAFVSFTAASSAAYLLNDVMDAEADRLHPDKRRRPIAAGTVPERVAVVTAVACAVLAAVTAAVTDDELLMVVLGYSALNLAYAHSLKRVAGLEIAIVASGFVLRPLAGAFATGVAPSAWFLAVCCLAAVAITIGKRLAELVRLGAIASHHRAALARYSVSALERIQVVVVLLMSGAYVGWALGRPSTLARTVDVLSLLPVLAAFATVAVLNRRGEGGAPEQLLLSNRRLQLLGGTWLVLFVVGVALA